MMNNVIHQEHFDTPLNKSPKQTIPCFDGSSDYLPLMIGNSPSWSIDRYIDHVVVKIVIDHVYPDTYLPSIVRTRHTYKISNSYLERHPLRQDENGIPLVEIHMDCIPGEIQHHIEYHTMNSYF